MSVMRPLHPRCVRWLVALGACACSSVPAYAFQLVIDCNTMTPDDLRNASTGILAADGSYSIFVNTHPVPSDDLWRAYLLASMSGTVDKQSVFLTGIVRSAAHTWRF